MYLGNIFSGSNGVGFFLQNVHHILIILLIPVHIYLAYLKESTKSNPNEIFLPDVFLFNVVMTQKRVYIRCTVPIIETHLRYCPLYTRTYLNEFKQAILKEWDNNLQEENK